MSEQKGNKKMVDAITPMEEDFAKWYTDIVKKEFMDYKCTWLHGYSTVWICYLGKHSAYSGSKFKWV